MPFETEKEYFERVDVQVINPSLHHTDNAIVDVEVTLSGEAAAVFALVQTLHSLLDEAEERLFHQGPRKVSAGINEAFAKGDEVNKHRPPLSKTLQHARQRLDSAVERLSKITPRL